MCLVNQDVFICYPVGHLFPVYRYSGNLFRLCPEIDNKRLWRSKRYADSNASGYLILLYSRNIKGKLVPYIPVISLAEHCQFAAYTCICQRRIHGTLSTTRQAGNQQEEAGKVVGC